uniref:Apolipoprotein A4 n=1 Tax=Callorhinchus milii TaxID=7868 RepID=V9L8M6_CALMI
MSPTLALTLTFICLSGSLAEKIQHHLIEGQHIFWFFVKKFSGESQSVIDSISKSHNNIIREKIFSDTYLLHEFTEKSINLLKPFAKEISEIVLFDARKTQNRLKSLVNDYKLRVEPVWRSIELEMKRQVEVFEKTLIPNLNTLRDSVRDDFDSLNVDIQENALYLQTKTQEMVKKVQETMLSFSFSRVRSLLHKIVGFEKEVIPISVEAQYKFLFKFLWQESQLTAQTQLKPDLSNLESWLIDWVAMYLVRL